MVMCLIGCRPDFIEYDLSKESITILSPPNNHITTTSSVKFWWEELKGANGYRLQLAAPTFDNIQDYLLDTSIAYNSFTYTLEPGVYEWRLYAMNGSSSSLATTYSITVDSSNDLSIQTLGLILPSNGSIVNSMTITFKWNTLYNASDYRLEVASPDFNGVASINAVVTVEDSSVQTFSEEGHYQWRVRGQSSTSNTPFTTFAFEIDTTSPNTPVLLTPMMNEVLTDSIVSFTWDGGIVTGSDIIDSLYVYSDSLLSNEIVRYGTSATSFIDTLIGGSYFWTVGSMDAAGNVSAYSTLSKFTIQ